MTSAPTAGRCSLRVLRPLRVPIPPPIHGHTYVPACACAHSHRLLTRGEVRENTRNTRHTRKRQADAVCFRPFTGLSLRRRASMQQAVTLSQVAPGITGKHHGCMPWVDRADAPDVDHRERGQSGILPPCRATCTIVPAEVRRSTAGARLGSEGMAGVQGDRRDSPVDGGGNCKHFRNPKVKWITALTFPTNPRRNACTLMAAR